MLLLYGQLFKTEMISYDLLLYLLSDSSFPSGSFCFSNGVEVLKSMGGHDEIKSYILDCLEMSAMELPFLCGAFHNSKDKGILSGLIRAYEVLNINDIKIESSEIQGKTFLSSVCKSFLRTRCDGIESSIALISDSPQYLPIVFGIFAKEIGLLETQACFLYLMTFLKNIVNASIRLDIMDSYLSQEFMLSQENVIADLITSYSTTIIPKPFTVLNFITENSLHQKNPSLDIYQGLHSTLNTKLFMS
eukprot:NODE_5_length_72347_cov_1.339331.p36 type:complete len:247 gc:universal NODE_5_length_72347_cov_1.339331:23360-22620(-)